jgi:hypothetical protein
LQNHFYLPHIADFYVLGLLMTKLHDLGEKKIRLLRAVAVVG